MAADKDAEFDIPEALAPIRQGDILIFTDVADDKPWDQRAIVLTADCDLAWGASRGLVTIAPVVSVETYIRSVWSERKVRVLRTRAISTCQEMISKRQRERDAQTSPISEDAIAQWLAESSSEEICAALGIDDQRTKDSMAAQVSVFRLCNREFGGTPDECITTLIEARRAISRAEAKAELEKAFKQAVGELQEIPQDAFYISRLPGVEQEKFYAFLRDLRHFPVSKITSSLTEAKEGKGLAFRVARLKPVFKYYLTQQFAMLFSRIGLPQEYTEEYKSSLPALANGVKV